jgi:translation elongation factor EF-1alpha
MFQFCQAVTDLPQCSAESQAITVTETVTPSSISQKVASMPSTHTTIQATCNCPHNRYWKLHQYSNSEFQNGTIYTSTIYKCIEVTKASRQVILFTANLTIHSFFQGGTSANQFHFTFPV